MFFTSSSICFNFSISFIITRVIASPHTAITEHDKRIAIQAFLCFHEYLSEIRGFDPFEDEIDLRGYAAKIIDELEETK